MAGQKKNYMFSDEPLTKYKRTELKKEMADVAAQAEVPAEAETGCRNSIEVFQQSISCTTLEASGGTFDDPSTPISRTRLEASGGTFDDPLSDESFLHDIIQDDGNDENSYKELYSSNEDLAMNNLEQRMQSLRSVELLQEEAFFESLNLNISRSPAELLLITLRFALSSTLSLTALSNVLKLVNLVCGTTVLPETRYSINKICGTADNVTFHSICPECTNYIGTFQGVAELKLCGNCNAPVNVSNASNSSFFAMIDPSEAICDLIKNHEDYYDYIVKERQHEHDHIKDIYDGELYRKFVRSLPESDRHSYVTTIFNTDGAPVFKSSKFSLWPIYLIVNEIPPQSRMDNAIAVGLWCGQTKPEMSAVLQIFVKFINNLSNTGINCTIKNDNRRLKIYALVACVDTQARAPMNGSSHFNAYYGCDWCLHEGEYFAGSMRYPFTVPVPVDRDHENTIQHATTAVRSGKRTFGIVSASPLLNLKNFDIIEGFTPDYMHCYLAGVASQFTDYILGHLTKTQIDFINSLLKNLRAPTQIGRLSRSLDCKGYWKAREWENWLLYYSVPILSVVMQNNLILKHWCLLVDALHILLQMDITFAELNIASRMLHAFVQQAEDMYSLKALTYNVHQLLHLAKSVYNWGPLFAHSTFPFEAANHTLLTSIHCAKGVILQIIKYESIQRTVKILENKVYPYCPQNVKNYCEQIGGPRAKNFYKTRNVTYLGYQKIVEDKYVQKFNISRTSKLYNKIVLRGCLYMSSQKQNKRSCNYYAQLNDNRFIEIIHFLITTNDEELTVCKIVKVKPHTFSNTIFNVLQFSEEIIISTNILLRSCVFIELENEACIVTVPNDLHY